MTMKKVLKNHFSTALVVAMLFALSSCAVKNVGETKITSNPEILETVGDDVSFSFTGEIGSKAFPKKAALEVAPFLVYGDQKKDTMKLDPIYLRGEKVVGEGQQINYENGGAFSYTGNIPYKGEEMNQAELHAKLTSFVPKEPVTKNMSNCTKCKYGSTVTEKVADGIIHTDKETSVSAMDILIAQHGYQKEVKQSTKGTIYFLVNKSDLNFKIDLNKNEEAKRALQNLNDFMTKGYVIQDITIDGYASPEGEGDKNDRLGIDRAKTAEKYFKKEQKDNVKDLKFVINGHGANWDGFVANVRKATNFKAGNSILTNINAKNPGKEREMELQKLMKEYPELKTDFLPNLRRADITVNALEPRRSDAEIKELAITKPEELSVEELLYAATMFGDFETQSQIYEKTAQLYPNQWNALNNAAASQIRKGNFDQAETMLNKANSLKPQQPEVLNNLGVVAAHKSDFKKAAEYFNQSEKVNGNVAYNKAVLDVRNGQYKTALNQMSNRSCDYNLALTQLLNKEYNAAQKTLECSKQKDAQTYYLLSVVGARKNDKTMLLTNLDTAIKQDANMKKTAARDAEFANYWNDANFQALVK